MIYQIEISSGKTKKFAKNPLNSRPHQFDTIEHAQHFADGMRRTFLMNRNNFQRQVPQYRVIEIAAR